jgi:hypothetical protein
MEQAMAGKKIQNIGGGYRRETTTFPSGAKKIVEKTNKLWGNHTRSVERIDAPKKKK